MTSARDQQIRALYQAALARPPAERDSFVAALTGDDQQLRASVQIMLASQGATDVGARAAADDASDIELPAGTSIGQYRIEGVVGRGGMGVVYRGTDTKLHRPVAIKFLSSAVADAETRRRFEQEARTTSSLNHPHIVTVYDIGEHDGRQFIVSELVDGGTLDDWMAKHRRRSARQSVELLTGIADGLAAAHAAGVLHRDVKPSNILLGSNGYAKLADFGLAKLVGADSSDPLRRSARATRAGVVVGTVAYMSPEQAAGQPLDARSDVFSFGIVLYELVAGRRPFEAANDLELLKIIAHAAPAPLPDDTPELLKAVLDRALEKEPADRYQTMQDLAADLKRVTRKPASVSVAAAGAAKRRARVPWLAGVVGVALGVAAALAAVTWWRPPTPAEPEMRFSIPVSGYALGSLAISPDGRQIVYASNANGPPQLWVRPIGALAARAVAGTDFGNSAFWSPDSRQIAFAADGRLKKLDLNAGPAQTLGDLSGGGALSGTWSSSGTILFAVAPNVFRRVDANGGPVVDMGESRAANAVVVGLPAALPDGDRFVYATTDLSRNTGGTGTALRVGSLTRGTRDDLMTLNQLGPPPSNVVPKLQYASGFLLSLYDGTLTAQRFDADARAVRGPVVPIAENIAEFSVSQTGILVYRETVETTASSLIFVPRRLVWVDRAGNRVAEIEGPSTYRLPVLSADGRRVALSVPGGTQSNGDIWTVDTARGVTARLTFDDAEESLAAWSPDGAQLVFNSGQQAIPGVPSGLYRRAANGTGSDELLFAGGVEELLVPFDWTPNGVILFGRTSLSTWQNRMDLWALELAGERTARPLVQSGYRNGGARVAPNGRWLAYAAEDSGRAEIVVVPFPNVANGKWQISARGGTDPRWRADGRELYYLAPDGALMVVDTDTAGDTFDSGTARVLFQTGLLPQDPGTPPDLVYDVTPDGERFLINEALPAGAGASSEVPAEKPLIVVVNWTTGLQAR